VTKNQIFQLPKHLPKRIALIVFSLFFIIAGSNHFANPDFYVAIMPPYLPFHLKMVYVSGILEILGGITIMVPRYRYFVGWGIILLLLAIFPANIHMALYPELFTEINPIVLYARLPIQLLFILWVYWITHNTAQCYA